MAFGHYLLGSHNFMVTALDSCVKWPLVVPVQLSTPTRLLQPGLCRSRMGSLDWSQPMSHYYSQVIVTIPEAVLVINWAGEIHSSVKVVGSQNMCWEGFS